jgi:hypothetical protein
MVECWHEVPNRRPNFSEIHSRLCQWEGVFYQPGIGTSSRAQSRQGTLRIWSCLLRDRPFMYKRSWYPRFRLTEAESADDKIFLICSNLLYNSCCCETVGYSSSWTKRAKSWLLNYMPKFLQHLITMI